MDLSSEAELIERAARGSRAAFADLANTYRDRLFRFLLVRCGNRADAEDATQDALIAAWRYLASYDSRWRFSTWLYRIALRKLPQSKLMTTSLIDEPADTTSLADSLELDNLWRLATRTLKPEAASALWLHYGEGMSVREVAGALSRSTAWVKVSLMRSRRRLAAEIDGERT